MSKVPEDVLERLSNHTHFAALPEVMGRLIVMFDDPEVTAAEAASLVGKDAGLVMRLLRIANSAYYGGTGNVTTVQQAIVKLGFRTAKAVVLSSAVYSALSRSAPDGIDLRPFWHHGLEVGVGAMMISEELCPRHAEEAFVAGLLHDVGRVALAMSFPDLFREQLQAGPEAWSREQERQRYGIDHAEAGAYLCRQWNLPDMLTCAMADHHTVPEELPGAESERIVICVGLADSLAAVSWAGPALARPECRLYREAASKVTGITEERLQQIQIQAAPQVEEWAGLFEIELCDPADLLTQANRRLFDLYRAVDELSRENEKLQAQILAEEGERAALEALKVICATFSHHINNATTTILGRAQLVNLALSRGEASELSGKIAQSMTVIENAVDTISGVLSELKCLTRFNTTSYHGRAQILKLERDITADMK